MNQIKPHSIWIGHDADGRAFRDIFDSDIRAVVQLAMEEPPIQPPRELIYLRFPLLDGGGNERAILRLAIDTIARLIEAKVPTLVCCGAGMSRSPAIAAAAITVANRSDLEQSLAMVVQHRPADVSPALLGEIKAILKDKD